MLGPDRLDCRVVFMTIPKNEQVSEGDAKLAQNYLATPTIITFVETLYRLIDWPVPRSRSNPSTRQSHRI